MPNNTACLTVCLQAWENHGGGSETRGGRWGAGGLYCREKTKARFRRYRVQESDGTVTGLGLLHVCPALDRLSIWVPNRQL